MLIQSFWIQFTSSLSSLQLISPCSFSVKRTEHTALKVLREQLFVHKSDLLSAFQELDKENTGTENYLV